VAYLITRVLVRFGLNEGALRLELVKDQFEGQHRDQRASLLQLYNRIDQIHTELESRVFQGVAPAVTPEIEELFRESEEIIRKAAEIEGALEPSVRLQQFRQFAGL
jgi:hypothetical protein